MIRERKEEYIPGDYLMVCDSCGFTYRRSQMKKRWDGMWVCAKDWEPRHPQEFVRAKADKIRVPVSRPQLTDGDITYGTATLGSGWTDNDNGTYTHEDTGEGENSNATFSATLSATDYYEVAIRVTDGGANGTVKGVCGGLETDAIVTGYATAYGQVTDVNGTIGITQMSEWTGTVTIKIRKVTTASDL